jgi:hypothetical protein
MWILTLWLSASAGELLLDAKVPAALSVDGRMLAQLYEPGVLRVPVSAGAHQLSISIDGTPQLFDVTVGEDEVRVILAGRTGVTLGEVRKATTQVAGVPVDVEFRARGPAAVMVQVGRERIVLAPEAIKHLSLALGDHPMTVRSSDGTSVYARGVLRVVGGEVMVVQVTEGATPEATGPGLVFRTENP